MALFTLAASLGRNDRQTLLESMRCPFVSHTLHELRALIDNFTASIETLTGPPSPPDSPIFFDVLSKCDEPESPLDTDDTTLLHDALLRLLRDHGQTTMSDPALLEIFSELVTNRPSATLFKYFCQEMLPAVPSFPRVVGGNLIVANTDREPGVKFNKHAVVTYRKFSEKTVRFLNRKIANVTRGLIPHALSENALSQDSTYVLINTLAFIAKWERPFTRIVENDFHRRDGTVRIPFLSVTGSFKYYKTESFTYVQIPYAYSSFQFEILIPVKADLERKTRTMAAELFGKGAERAEEGEISLAVPQFEIQSSVLDFSSEFAIPDRPAVHQLSLVAIDQFGTKAAAGTIIMDRSVAQTAIIADRPFAFQIRGKNPGDVLFAGYIADPTTSQTEEPRHEETS
jgi:hypothetical protein